jgi:class 3 adenylate cyclase
VTLLSDRDVNGDPLSGDRSVQNGRVQALAARLEEGGLAAYIWDADWRLVWASSGMQALLGEADDDRLGVGEHMLVLRRTPPWSTAVPPESESARRWLRQHISLMLECEGDAGRLLEKVNDVLDDPGDRTRVAALVKDAAAAPQPPAAVLTTPVQTAWWGDIIVFTTAVREPDGQLLCVVELGWPHLPPPLAVLLVRGEVEMFERMARLQEPSRREAAILFVDLEGSGALSRRLPSATYFQLVRWLTSEIDGIVAAGGGVVGRHAGDGASAFFLADEAGSASLAASAAIEAAWGLNALGPRAARETGIEESAVRLKVGVHWGSTLYMGQLTGGRLEVTALGDEVNACARVQETARGDSVLATKDLLERLDEAAAERLGLDPGARSYVALGEVEGASPKALRDAGGLAVTALARDGHH